MLNYIQINKYGPIQTSQTGGQLYNDTSPYEVSECSLVFHNHNSFLLGPIPPSSPTTKELHAKDVSKDRERKKSLLFLNKFQGKCFCSEKFFLREIIKGIF